MTRKTAIECAERYFDNGRFLDDLGRRVGWRTQSQHAESAPALRAYLSEEIEPALGKLGFVSKLHDNPVSNGAPFLVARRIEDPALPTVLVYGHGDVVRGQEEQWTHGAGPWQIAIEDDRWYGRGTADNKGQHTVNLGALGAAIEARAQAGKRLGFNVTVLMEMGEEVGSPGLNDLCAALKDELRADVLIASDGPRIGAARPTIFLGSRGAANFELSVTARDKAYHSGNWGGLLSNPAIRLAHALASIVDEKGRVQVEGLRAPAIDAAVAAAIADLEVGGDPGDPVIDTEWGEPGLTPAERVFGSNTFEVLAMVAGNPALPVGAIPATSRVFCQLRFVVGTDIAGLEAHLRKHLDLHGFHDVDVRVTLVAPATRLAPDHPWVSWAVRSITQTTGKKVAILPNLGGTIPNDAFADVLGLPTIWVPHSYPGCAQHAPNEHMLGTVAREALRMMAGLFWDLGEIGTARVPAAHG
ncbi:M20 family metallopeptidase [Paraburkholderia unamae]|uniref:Acetylornithine deacetylase/succinyl-diaminopimelate desuccinylase-like protein n=1 Tax=Paraburkholderia unamae TaxID=219649 RepID=A0ABX5KHS6_9BURK|nr:M20 family metallopeptidase [Paraburkholderia unamae]PVX80004.1 acetylornithine deacetylase/succinyl-diaminopimelate desuccinylase-like protein [Paraburkholderia unamae]CAG9268637.1 M20_dimer domain-containing protein [Paraburkholderia unamae]